MVKMAGVRQNGE